MLKLQLLVCFQLLILMAAVQPVGKQKAILFAGAYPNAETAISEALTKYARPRYKVYVMIATDGKDGRRVQFSCRG